MDEEDDIVAMHVIAESIKANLNKELFMMGLTPEVSAAEIMSLLFVDFLEKAQPLTDKGMGVLAEQMKLPSDTIYMACVGDVLFTAKRIISEDGEDTTDAPNNIVKLH